METPIDGPVSKGRVNTLLVMQAAVWAAAVVAGSACPVSASEVTVSHLQGLLPT